jgi:integrase
MHELRRTFATRLRDRGVPLEDVQRLGRWASSKMLLEVYSASDDGRLRRAAEAVSAAMSE